MRQTESIALCQYASEVLALGYWGASKGRRGVKGMCEVLLGNTEEGLAHTPHLYQFSSPQTS